MTATTPHAPLLAWLAAIPESDRKRFYADLTEAVATSRETDDPCPIEDCLRQWRLAADGIATASLRDQLLEN